ncbi:hypothetical protein ABIA31_008497 [Catenulispora sp. MAP5-51]|uniref:SIR2 family protein n=1 Tax=Catenulispora sp. MAP5-51 TaxID=3156298 RepID=UPI003518DF32
MSSATTAGPAPKLPAVPGSVLDPRDALAMNLHASPGVYAVLLGAGISLPSGVKTGWGVVEDLVSRVATVRAVDGADERTEALADPEAWWHKTFGEALSYSGLLAHVAPTPAARQAHLARYFDPDEDGVKGPTAAHRALAQLVARGYIRVILTTNFDRLMEQALEALGIQAQVVHRPSAIENMTPLAHTKVTVIKLHGDYADLDQLNTFEELNGYDDRLKGLLDRVLDEYGLLVCGWSADWDKALVRSIENTRSRRYPLFWSSFGRLGDDARRLIAAHSAPALQGVTADELFTDLLVRVEALDSMAAAPVTRDMAVARLKKALPDPVRRVELADLVNDAAKTVTGGTARQVSASGTSYLDSVLACRAEADVLLHLLAHGVYHDDGTHRDLWRAVRARLAGVRGQITANSYNHLLEAMRHYPALLATWTMGVSAILAGREEYLAELLSTPAWSDAGGTARPKLPAHYLNPRRVLDGDALNDLVKSANGQIPQFQQAALLRNQAREPLQNIEPDDAAYAAVCDRFELLASLVAFDPAGGPEDPWLGPSLSDRHWERPHALANQVAEEIDPDWPLLRGGAFGGDADRAKTAMKALTEWRKSHYRGW